MIRNPPGGQRLVVNPRVPVFSFVPHLHIVTILKSTLNDFTTGNVYPPPKSWPGGAGAGPEVNDAWQAFDIATFPGGKPAAGKLLGSYGIGFPSGKCFS